jgi:hypothetical protein
MNNKLTEILVSEIKKRDNALIIALKTNPRATFYKREVYWFHTIQDYAIEVSRDEQEFEEEKEAYAYAFDAIKTAQELSPNVRIKIVDFGDDI